jgi:putative two-component system response regulator
MTERDARLLVLDDESATREMVAAMFLEEGGYQVVEAGTAAAGFSFVTAGNVDLVLLDVLLPDESGFNLCRRMKSVSKNFLPIILVTALNDVADKVKGLEAGADDFLTKPFVKAELLARTRSHLRTKAMVDRVDRYRRELTLFNQRLQDEVEIRTRQLQTALAELRAAKKDVEATRVEIVDRLGVAAEYRDEETGQHIRRMSRTVHELALAYGLIAEKAELYRLAAPLHDIGKMGVRDHVLLKVDQLEEGEIELIREHTRIGAAILANPGTELLRIAQEMARSHHERWDGKGYPDGLKGEEIPLPARICAVADVFDALTHRRIYRSAPLSVEEAADRVRDGAGAMFDPKIVEAFTRALSRLLAGEEQA